MAFADNLNENLAKVKKATSSSSSSDAFPVQVTAMSGEIEGKFGKFRTVTISGTKYNVDARKLTNAIFFSPKATAYITMVEAKRTNGETGTFIDTLAFIMPAGAISMNG